MMELEVNPVREGEDRRPSPPRRPAEVEVELEGQGTHGSGSRGKGWNAPSPHTTPTLEPQPGRHDSKSSWNALTPDGPRSPVDMYTPPPPPAAEQSGVWPAGALQRQTSGVWPRGPVQSGGASGGGSGPRPGEVLLVDKPSGSFSLREQLAMMMEKTMAGRVVSLVSTILSILAVVLYVVASYFEESEEGEDEAPEWLQMIQLAFDVFFLLDYLFFLFIADDRLAHALRPATIADLLSVLPILRFVVDNASFDAFTIFRFFRCVRIIRLHRVTEFGAISELSQMHRQLLTLAFTTLCFLFVSAGLIHATDVLMGGGQYYGIPAGDLIQFHEAFYLLVVTITTVGYGDLSPSEDFSRSLMACIILAGIAILPRQVSRLHDTLRGYSKYFTTFRPHNATWKHCVLVGPPTQGGISAMTIRSLVKGFTFQDHGDIKMHVVVLSLFEPNQDTLQLLENPKYKTHLSYVKGHVMDSDGLDRCRAAEAQAFFVCVNKYDNVRLQHEEDTEAIMSTLAIKRFKSKMKVIVELNSEDSKNLLSAYHLLNVDIICIEELRNGLLAHSCAYPGISTMLMNFVQTHNTTVDSQDPLWLQQYLWGASQQLYEVDISCCKGLGFCMAVHLLMTHFKLMLITVQEKSTSQVWRNPGNLYIIAEGDTGFVLSHTRLDLKALSRAVLQAARGFEEECEQLRSQVARMRSRSMARVLTDSILEEFSPKNKPKTPQSKPIGDTNLPVQRQRVELSGHIVVLGSIVGSQSFIEPLRVKQSRSEDITKLRPIVIVSPESNEEEIRLALAPFSSVFHITGSSLDLQALENASVKTAERVVILRDSSLSQRWGLNQHTEVLREHQMQYIDAENVLCYRQILDTCAHRQDLPIIELIHMPNMRFLSMSALKCPHNFAYYRWPLYAAGQVVSTTTFDTLFTHVFLYPGMLEMFSTLAHKSRIPQSRQFQVHDSGFLCTLVPSSFYEVQFGAFFDYCLDEHEAICLGLYRYNLDEPCNPYVFTNPSSDENLLDGDAAFFLAPPGFSLGAEEGMSADINSCLRTNKTIRRSTSAPSLTQGHARTTSGNWSRRRRGSHSQGHGAEVTPRKVDVAYASGPSITPPTEPIPDFKLDLD